MKQPNNSLSSFSDTYRRWKEEAPGVSEPPNRNSHVPESLVRSIWFDGLFQTEQLQTEDGQAIRVASPGRWNVESGPDFIKAEIAFASFASLTGDVEVHVSSSDWHHHGHHTDPAYNGVILHVAMWNDTGQPVVKNEAGEDVPQLILSKFLQGDVQSLAEGIETPGHSQRPPVVAGLCKKRLAELKNADDWLGQFLDLSGDERILAKATYFEDALKGTTLEYALYEGMMEALGYKVNKSQFRKLSKLLPLETIRRFVPLDLPTGEATLHVQALLFGFSGLLPESLPPGADGESIEHAGSLCRLWKTYDRELPGVRMNGDEWRFSSTRPLNYPQRRIAGMSALIARNIQNGLMRGILEAIGGAANTDRAKLKRLEEFLSPQGEGYWATHCTFGGKPIARATRLIGKERASAIILNVIIPVMLVHARRKGSALLEQELHSIYASHPRVAENSVTKFMNGLLFDSEERARRVVNRARRQFGLYQLYRDCCDNPSVTCERCTLNRTLINSTFA